MGAGFNDDHFRAAVLMLDAFGLAVRNRLVLCRCAPGQCEFNLDLRCLRDSSGDDHGCSSRADAGCRRGGARLPVKPPSSCMAASSTDAPSSDTSSAATLKMPR